MSADVTFFETQRFFDSVDSPFESIPLRSLVKSYDTDATNTTTMEKKTSRPLQIYHRQQRPPRAITSSMSADLPPTDLNMPIAIRKGISATTVHLISNFVTYDRLYSAFRSFALSISSESFPRNYQEAILLTQWKAAMDKEMHALVSRGTWDLVSKSAGTNVVTCK